jgi:hypothetical protein
MYKILHLLTGEFLWTIRGSSVFWVGEPLLNKNAICYYFSKEQAEKSIRNACYITYLLYNITGLVSHGEYSYQKKEILMGCVEAEFEIIEV